ncbi:LPS assembly lipoprotein LptE [Arvimicrobium flavum]|uniref:LPS assembly lipoprotein LptE n=1 Tax=Arvimicrobium flavum TaxID=3393320 RepID=UPI003084421A
MMRAVSIAVLAAVLGASAAGCTVRPLYSDAALTPGGETTNAALSSVFIKPSKTRYGQEVRNQLIFLFNGGQAQTSTPTYELELGVVAQREISTISQTTSVSEPTAATVTVYSNYTLFDAATQKPIATGSRQIASQYDIPRQEFAAYRAQRDAENRAARELAQLLSLAVAQDLARHGGR